MMRRSVRCWLVVLSLTLFVSIGVSQESKPAGSNAAAAAQSQPAQQQPQNPNAAIGEDLSAASHNAEESAEHEENAQFKYSASVRWMAKLFNADPHLAYFVSLVINFGLLILFFYMLLKSKLPTMFRERTAAIQKGIREAEAASAEATKRLREVEAHLAKLDAEVADIRREAEQNAVLEEERIRKAAEEDKQKVIAGAESEISAIARNARRELKTYAASLAIDLAGRQIHVDEPTDHALVREFVDHLGKDGR